MDAKATERVDVLALDSYRNTLGYLLPSQVPEIAVQRCGRTRLAHHIPDLRRQQQRELLPRNPSRSNTLVEINSFTQLSIWLLGTHPLFSCLIISFWRYLDFLNAFTFPFKFYFFKCFTCEGLHPQIYI